MKICYPEANVRGTVKAKIYQPTKNAMQSGKANTQQWLLVYEPQSEARFTEPLMGWIGSSDMHQELRMQFDSQEAAVAYANRHNIPYEVIKPKIRKMRIQQYADNFTD